jgi:glycosyltransferase involved in cell wall biosynthesis
MNSASSKHRQIGKLSRLEKLRGKLTGVSYHQLTYRKWVAEYDTPAASDLDAMRKQLEGFRWCPIFSVVMPVWNSNLDLLRAAIESVRAQVYASWELCIADDASDDSRVRDLLREYEKLDSRIHCAYRPKRGHISVASNTALSLVNGDYVVLLDHDDLLPPHALHRVAEKLCHYPDTDILYSDEDQIDEEGERSGAYFKPDWSPDLMYSQNLISHLGVYRTSLIEEVGGFRPGYEGSQDYDLALRCIEKTSQERIRHIPTVLYHWRKTSGSAAMGGDSKRYAYDAAVRALADHFERLEIQAKVEQGRQLGSYRVSYALPAKLPLVSIIRMDRRPTRTSRRALRRLMKHTAYPNFEVLTLGKRAGGRESSRVRFLESTEDEGEVGAKNRAAREARGSVLCFIDADMKPLEPIWLSEMTSHALRPDIGAVGPKINSRRRTTRRTGLPFESPGGGGTAFVSLPSYTQDRDYVQSFSAVSDACMVTTREVFEHAGGFNDAAFSGTLAAVDFCLRLREAGHRIVFTPHAEFHCRTTRRSDLTDDSPKAPKEVDEFCRRWSNRTEPFYNPNLCREKGDYRLAFPPCGPLLGGHHWTLFPESKLAHKYCHGRGIEIGGSAHNPFGLTTRNVDRFASMDTTFKKGELCLTGTTLAVDVVARGDWLPFADESQDFVVSSHVLEHFPDAIKALVEWDRVVRPGGTLFMIVPHKERTFDRDRERTPLAHLISDFENNVSMQDEDDSRHYHVWITEDIVSLVTYMIEAMKMRWQLAEVQDVDDKVGNGFTVVIRKTQLSHPQRVS